MVTVAVAVLIVVPYFVTHNGIKSGFRFIDVFSNAYFDFVC